MTSEDEDSPSSEDEDKGVAQGDSDKENELSPLKHLWFKSSTLVNHAHRIKFMGGMCITNTGACMRTECWQKNSAKSP
jgi:hypothetical protein